MNNNVLISNGQLRKSLSAARSLGKKGLEITITEETTLNVSGYSKYVRRNLKSPSVSKEPNAYLEWMLETADKYNLSVYMPMDDDTVSHAIENKEILSRRFSMLLPDRDLYKALTNKFMATQIAKEHNLDCPITHLPSTYEEALACAKMVGFPLILKQPLGSGSRGVRKVESLDTFKTAYDEVSMLYGRPMVQQFINLGPRVDVCLILDANSKNRAVFTQEEVRHFPIEMGPSTVQKSVKLPVLEMLCINMMEAIGWTGIAEFEFMLDKNTGKYMFMEVNTRFWNSLELAVHCGVDFPMYYYLLTQNRPLPQLLEYPLQVYCSNLLPGDILHYLFNKSRRNMVPKFMSSKLHDDIFSLNDFGPIIGFFLSAFRHALNPQMWRFFFSR